MSSYNNIEKIKYSSEDCVVTLQEYIVFENERAEEKYVVFKFSNNVNQQLLGMEFEVSQFGVDNDLVEKSVVIYNKFLAKPVQSFVPNAKLKVNYACKTLSVRLLQAAFDRFIWKEGQFLDNSYKFEHYAEDEDTEAAKKSVPAAPVKVKAQKPAPAPKKRKGLPFTAKNSTKKNVARFPAVFNAIVCLLAMGTVGFAVYDFTSKSDSFTVNDFDVKVMDADAKTVSVIGYGGENTSVTIPAMIEGYTVVRIGENAFKNSDIQSVKFNSTRLYIESYAFGGCENLKTVSSEAAITVHGYAFYNCTALRTVTLPGATFVKNSLIGCTNVTTLEYGSIGANSLEEVFGGKLPSKLNAVNGSTPDPNPDPDPNPEPDPGGDFEYDPGKTYSYGELNGKGVDGYAWTKEYETVNGEIITVNPESQSLGLSSEVKGISEKVYPQLGNVTVLTVNDTSLLSVDVMNAFSNVTKLTIENHDAGLGKLDLSYFTNLLNLTVPCYDNDRLVNLYNITQYLDYLTLTSTARCTTIPYLAFAGIRATNIVVAEGFTACEKSILLSDRYAVSLTLPGGIEYGEGVIGSSCTSLESVDVHFDVITVSYALFNKSYSYTKTLVVRTGTIMCMGFLANDGNYALDRLELYADASEVTLNVFINGTNYYVPVNPTTVSYKLGDEPSWFTDGYTGIIE